MFHFPPFGKHYRPGFQTPPKPKSTVDAVVSVNGIAAYPIIRTIFENGGFGSVAACVMIMRQGKTPMAFKTMKDPQIAFREYFVGRWVQASLRDAHRFSRHLVIEGALGEEPAYHLVSELEDFSLQQLKKTFARRLPTKKLPAKLVLYIFQKLLFALRGCRERRMLHMDIKPGNVFLTLRVDEETQRVQDIDVKLADYSLAYINKDEVDMKELGYRGTPGFMSTDIFTVKKYTADSDLFSVIHMALDLFMPIGAPAMLYTHMPKEYLDRVIPLRLDAVTLRERTILQTTGEWEPKKTKRESIEALAGSHAARAIPAEALDLFYRVLCAPIGKRPSVEQAIMDIEIMLSGYNPTMDLRVLFGSKWIKVSEKHVSQAVFNEMKETEVEGKRPGLMSPFRRPDGSSETLLSAVTDKNLHVELKACLEHIAKVVAAKPKINCSMADAFDTIVYAVRLWSLMHVVQFRGGGMNTAWDMDVDLRLVRRDMFLVLFILLHVAKHEQVSTNGIKMLLYTGKSETAMKRFHACCSIIFTLTSNFHVFRLEQRKGADTSVENFVSSVLPEEDYDYAVALLLKQPSEYTWHPSALKADICTTQSESAHRKTIARLFGRPAQKEKKQGGGRKGGKPVPPNFFALALKPHNYV